MCAIAGILSRAPVNPRALEAMLAAQKHRGPDGRGVWFNTPRTTALGHCRLAVLDLSPLAAQPMQDITGQYVITYNGEIYNYRELREELRRAGVEFRSASDTEVLLEAYKHWGEQCLHRLNGMFSFAIYHNPTGRLFCARDRFGEKPFLFVAASEFFAFASEYKALLLLAEVPLACDDLRLLRSCHRHYKGLDNDRETVFPAISQLRPAEAMLLDFHSGKRRIWRYWDIPPGPTQSGISETAACQQFQELLTDAVRLRLRSDVPLGSCLSGGLDSTAIVCLARNILGPQTSYHCFTARFPGSSRDEWAFAQQAAGAANAITHSVAPNADRLAGELEDLLWFNELPVGSGVQYAQYCLFRLAREHGITVLLDGQGSDELLAGYPRYFEDYRRALRAMKQGRRWRQEARLIRQRYPGALPGPGTRLLRRVPHTARRWLGRRLNRGTSPLHGMKPEWASQVQSLDRAASKEQFNALADTLYRDCFEGYLTTLLRYGDRNSMAHSREVRLPFCDHRLAEFVFSLPPWFLMGEAQTKRLLRESLRGMLPETIRTRWTKFGLLPPQEAWFAGSLMPLATTLFHDPSFNDSPYWDAQWWRRALARYQKGETSLAWSFWSPLVSETWRRAFLGRFSGQPRLSLMNPSGSL